MAVKSAKWKRDRLVDVSRRECGIDRCPPVIGRCTTTSLGDENIDPGIRIWRRDGLPRQQRQQHVDEGSDFTGLRHAYVPLRDRMLATAKRSTRVSVFVLMAALKG